MSEVKERYYEEYEDLDDALYKIDYYYWAHEYIKELERHQKEVLNFIENLIRDKTCNSTIKFQAKKVYAQVTGKKLRG